MVASDYPRFGFVVLGMHRSGTSALAGMLSRYGADAPKTQMRPTDDNPLGYYESTPIKVLNERILDSAGTSWDDWTSIANGWFTGPRAAALRSEARAAIEEEFGSSPLFVFKDPRNSRLWPFWRDVLAGMGIKPIPIIMLRNPEEVAQSLLRRDKLPLSLGRLVWLRHQLDAERLTRGCDRVIATYDEVLKDPRSLVARIEATSGFAMPRRSQDVDDEVTRFIDPQLRRFKDSAQDGAAPSAEIFGAAYHLLRNVGISAASLDQLDGIDRKLEELSGLIHGVGAPVREMARDLGRLSRERDALSKAQRDLSEERDILGEMFAEKHSLVEGAIATRDEVAKDRDRLNGVIKSLQAENTGLREEAKSLREENTGLRDEIKGLQAENKGLQDGIKGLQAESKGLRDEVRSMQAEMGRWADIAAKREASLTQRAREDVVKERERIQAEFYKSSSWKLTAPVRWLGRLGRHGTP